MQSSLDTTSETKENTQKAHVVIISTCQIPSTSYGDWEIALLVQSHPTPAATSQDT